MKDIGVGEAINSTEKLSVSLFACGSKVLGEIFSLGTMRGKNVCSQSKKTLLWQLLKFN